jgi:hypothetical protein
MRELGKALGYLARDTFDVRFNAGGTGVSGDLVLHTNGLYIHVAQRPGEEPRQFYFRSCVSRHDYRGGENHWLPISRLLDIQDLTRELRSGA